MDTRALKLAKVDYTTFGVVVEAPNNNTNFFELQVLTSYPGVIGQEFHYGLNNELNEGGAEKINFYSTLYIEEIKVEERGRKRDKVKEFFTQFAMNMKYFSADLRFF